MALGLEQEFGQAGVLDALGDDFQRQVAAQVDHRFDDLGRALVLVHGQNEIAVDLQRIERQLGQPGEGAEAGAEVVERQRGTGLAQPGQGGGGAGCVAHDVAFGDLQLQRAPGQAGVGDDAGDVLDQIGPFDLADRQVDAAEQLARRRMPLQPLGQLARGLGHHQQAEVVHQAHFVGQTEEFVGRHQATLGVTPAGQGLEPGHGAGQQIDDGLVEGLDLAAQEGVAQVGFQRQPGQAVALQRPAIGGDPAPTGRLGLFDGQFDPAQHLGGIGRVGPALGLGRADRDGRIDVEAGDAQRLFQRLAHPLGHHAGAARREDGELVLADAGGVGVMGEGGVEARAEGGEDQIGALMPQGLVQSAQAVDVGHHQLIVAGLGQLFPGAGQEGASVQQAGQPVEVGGGELGLERDDPGGAQAVLQPDAAPDAGLGIAHAQADGDLGAFLLRLEDLLGQRPVLRDGHGGEGGAGTLRGQRSEPERPGRAGKAHLIIGRGPDPQGGVRGGQRLNGGRRVPGQTSGASVQTPKGPDRTTGISRRVRPRH